MLASDTYSADDGGEDFSIITPGPNSYFPASDDVPASHLGRASLPVPPPPSSKPDLHALKAAVASQSQSTAAEDGFTTEGLNLASGDSAEDKFMGIKERRRSSASKLCEGDYIGASRNAAVIKLMAKNGDREIAFADMMIKINKRNKMQERIILITDQAIYNMDPGNYKVKRRVPLKELGSMSLSKLPDNFFCLHVPSEYDYLLVSAKKIEIVSKLSEQWEKANLSAHKLPVRFANTFEYMIDKDLYKEISFTVDPRGIKTEIFSKKKVKPSKNK